MIPPRNQGEEEAYAHFGHRRGSTALDLLTACLRQACPQGELHPFSSGHKALAWLKATGAGFDAAFLEVALPEMSGVALARQLQARCPRGNLIFVTEFPQYMGEPLTSTPADI